eukprot:scaffold41048_cov24-Cyclotella_meneghiniana.AAC.1
MSDWCLVIVADLKSPEEYDVKWSKATAPASHFSPRVEYLTPERQQKLWFKSFIEILPWNNFARKNIGYLYAIANGAQRVWDFDDDNALYWFLGTDLPDVPSLPNLISHIDDKGSALELKNFTYRVFNPYPIMGGPENSWPRGFPVQEIKNEQSYVSIGREGAEFDEVTLADGQLGVVQSLANKQPDVDAMYRLTQYAIPFDFKTLLKHDLRPVLVPSRALTPYNAQATLHLQSALWGLLLPITVAGRVSDIWRSFITQRLCWDINVRVGYASEPLVVQDRNVHDIVGDLEAEGHLYQRSDQLVDFLNEWHSSAPTLPERIEELWIALYERNYIQESDVKSVQRWLMVLKELKYNFPKIKHFGPMLKEEQQEGQSRVVNSDVPMSKCPGVPKLTIWTSDVHDGTRIDIPTMLADLGMKVILGGHKRSRGPYPEVFETEGVSVYDGELGSLINRYKTHSWPLTDQEIRTNFEFWKNNPVMKGVDLYFCSFPSSMCEMWLPFNKSIAFIPGHRYALGRCNLKARNKLNTRLKKMMLSSNPRHIFGALSKYDKEYLEYYLGSGPPSGLHTFRTYATGFGYLWKEAFDPGPPLFFNRTEILSIPDKAKIRAKENFPSNVVDLHSLYKRYTGAQLQQHPGIVLWAYSVMSYKLIDFYALAVPLYVPSLKFYHVLGFGLDRTITGSALYCKNSTLKSLLSKDLSSVHLLSPEDEDIEAEQYWLQFSDFYTFPHITYFDSMDDLGRKIARNDPLAIRKGMISENKKRLADFKQEMCDALVGIEANRQIPEEYQNP